MNKNIVNKTKISTRASTATKTLEEAWQMIMEINRKKYKIPLAVIIILSAGDRGKKRGHHARNAWEYKGQQRKAEVGINSSLFKSPENLLCTMIHEATHAILTDKHNAGMGSTRSYHTKVFRDTCFKLGLHCEFYNTRHGWNLTRWPKDQVPQQYIPVVKYLRKNLPKGTSQGGDKPKVSKLGYIRLECKCKIQGGNSILVTKTMLRRISEKGGIRCELCDSLFTILKLET